MTEPKTYHIERIVDLLEVPIERREQCVKELLMGLALAEFADAQLFGPMTWTDDGDMSCSLDDADGNEILKLEVGRD